MPNTNSVAIRAQCTRAGLSPPRPDGALDRLVAALLDNGLRAPEDRVAGIVGPHRAGLPGCVQDLSRRSRAMGRRARGRGPHRDLRQPVSAWEEGDHDKDRRGEARGQAGPQPAAGRAPRSGQLEDRARARARRRARLVVEEGVSRAEGQAAALRLPVDGAPSRLAHTTSKVSWTTSRATWADKRAAA